ncbi:MAG: putative cytokinetic ring protein SteA [Acidimicrobiia bacterium]
MLITGKIKCGPRTKDLAKVIDPGDIAVISHEDLDRVAAESLVQAKVSAVINLKTSITSRYPNGGPLVLESANIPLVDIKNYDFAHIGRFEIATIDDSKHHLTISDDNSHEEVDGKFWSRNEIDSAMEAGRNNIGNELKAFAKNTLEYIDKEADEFFAPVSVPDLKTNFKNRHVLVVVRGHDYKKDLKALKPYIKEYKPVIIAVDGGADALLEAGLTSDVIIGDFDSVTEKALYGPELILHAHLDGSAPGRDELEKYGVEYKEFASNGMSEDVAMLLAYELGATLIVAVGTHGTMVELLDKGRRGMASTFLTRTRLGPVLVDAKGVSRLYEGRIKRSDVVLLLLAALAVVVIMAIVAEPLRVFLSGLRLTIRDIWYSILDWFR